MKSVLIISANALGDTYLSSSALIPLKEMLGNVSVDLLTLRDCGIFTGYLGYDNVFFVERRSAAELFRIRKFLAVREYNYVFSFFPGRMNSLLVMQSLSKNKYYYKNILRVEDWYKNPQSVYFNAQKTGLAWEPPMNYLERINLLLGSAFGTDFEVKKPLFSFPVSPEKENPGEVLINFSSREESRSLDRKLVMELSEYIFRVFGRRVCILDFRNEITERPDFAVFPENYDFSGIMNRVVSSELFISVDSFLIHPAEAYGVNLLGLFGPTNPGSVLSSPKKEFIRINSLKDLKLEDVIPSVRKMLGEE